MTRKAFIYIIALLLPLTAVRAQVSVKAMTDSTAILLGEQTALRVTVVHPAATTPVFPQDLQPLLKAGLEVVGKGQVSSEPGTPSDGMTTTKCVYTLTSFEPALYYIPSINVKVGKQTYPTPQLALKVNDIKVDTVHTDKYYGPKEITDPAYTWRDWMRLFLLAVLLIVCCAGSAAAYLWMQMAGRKKQTKKEVKAVVPPHKEAEAAIEQLKDNYGREELTSKDYYTSLIGILRRYVSKRYGFKADEMTSYELVARLIELGEKEEQPATSEGEQGEKVAHVEPDYTELREILATADLTKFAKLQTDQGEDERNLRRLSDYIETTKSDKPPVITEEDIPEDTGEKVSDVRRRRKIVFVLSLVVTVLILAVVVYEIHELLL